MLHKNPQDRISAIDALKHPWFQINGTNLLKLNVDFSEVDEIPMTDDEPSLANTVNLSLITTSPIWNKSYMRDVIKNVNLE